MIKKIMLLGSVTVSLVGLAQANEPDLDAARVGLVTISDPVPPISDIACTSAVPVIREYVYTLQNTGPADLDLGEIVIEPNPDDTYGTPTFTETCGGTIAGLGNCTVTVNFAQPTCTYPISEVIDQTLTVPIYNNLEPQVTADIQANVTVIGSGADFAVLGGPNTTVTNNPANPLLGLAQLVGNLGAKVVSGNFSITDGESYTSGDILTNAQNDMAAAQSVLLNNVTGCKTEGNLVDGNIFTSGYYCLSNGLGILGSTVTVDGTITLNGPGNFVFFVNAGDSGTGNCGTTSTYCGLQFNPTAQFNYINGASSDNVFWVVGGNGVLKGGTAGTVTLQADATIDGTIMSVGPITAATAGTSSALVNGRLASFDIINLQSNTITIK